jgi:hypothetical protein
VKAKVVPEVKPAAPPKARAQKATPTPPKKNRRFIAWIGIVFLVFVLLIAVSGVGYFGIQQRIARQTADAEFQSAIVAGAASTSTERARVSATAKSAPTQTAAAFLVAQSVTDTPALDDPGSNPTLAAQDNGVATAQALDSWALELDNSKELVFGPNAGSLIHNPGDGLIKAARSDVDLQNFVVSVRFTNPYAHQEHSWDYGIFFRHSGENDQFRLVVRSDQTWVLRNTSGQPDGPVIQQGAYGDLDVGVGGENILRLVCEDGRGVFYINGALVSELDLTTRISPGDIILVTGVYGGDEVANAATGYQDFTVWEIP